MSHDNHTLQYHIQLMHLKLKKINVLISQGILTLLSNRKKILTFLLRYWLTLPWSSVDRNSFSFRRKGFTPFFRLLQPEFLIQYSPEILTEFPSYHTKHCSTSSKVISNFLKIKTSVISFSPVHFLPLSSRLMSYYAFIKGWLLLSLPLNCLRRQGYLMHLGNT